MKRIRNQHFFFVFILSITVCLSEAVETQQKTVKDLRGDTAIETMAKVSGKMLKMEPFEKLYRKRLIFDTNYAPQAEAQIIKIAQQLHGLTTIGEWIGRAPLKEKFQRRQNFSDVMSSRLPAIVVGRYNILFSNPKNKKQMHSFTLFPERRGIVTLLDDIDISPQKKESFQNWSKRIHRSQRTANWMVGGLIPRAYADDGFDEFRFAQILQLMSNEEWEKFNARDVLKGGTGGVNDGGLVTKEDVQALQDVGFLKSNLGLKCMSDGSSFLKMQLGGGDVDIRIEPRRGPNDRRFKLNLGNDGRSQIDVSADGVEAHFTQDGRTYSHEMLIPAVAHSLNYGNMEMVPESSPARPSVSTGPVVPQEIISAYEGARACQALHAVEMTFCDDKIGKATEMAICVGEILKAGLPSAGLSSYVNRSPLAKLDREQALDLKFQLTAIYYDRPVNFAMGTDFPSEKTIKGYPKPKFSGETPIPYDEIDEAFLVDYKKNDPYHTAMMNCIQGSQNGNGYVACSNIRLQKRNTESVFIIQDVLARGVKYGTPISSLKDRVRDIVVKKDDCAKKFIDDKMLTALDQYDKMSMLSYNDSKLTQIELELKQILSVADVARAVCGNKQLRESLESSNIAQ